MATATVVRQPIRMGQIAGWLAAALVLGCMTALVGVVSFYAVLAVAVVLIFGAIAARFPSGVMVACVFALALVPFSVGIETGVLPKLFGDEMLLLLYLVVLAPMYWMTRRTWVAGSGGYLWLMAGFVFCQAISLAVDTDLIAFRNLLETFILGPILLVLFLQESGNIDNHERLPKALVWVAVIVAALSIVERIAQRNPILENLEIENNFQYLSPKIVAITEGVYRPYATFFHPSEAGTFMAMCLPFALRQWMRKRGWFVALQILVIAGGLGVNATRGVWVAAILSLLLLARNPLKIVLTAIPVVGIGSSLAYLFLKSTPFMQRLSDANNFLGRLIYWRLAAQVFADHILLGTGHMQFQKLYLDYVHEVSDIAQLSMTQIQVIDNMYLTTLVEHGLVGFIGLVTFFVCTALYLKRLRGSLLQKGLLRQASLVQAVQLVLVIYIVSGFFADVNQFTKATKLLFIVIGFGVGAARRSLRAANGLQLCDKPSHFAELEVAA